MNFKNLAQYLEDGKWETIACAKYKQLCKQEPTRWEHLELKSKPIQGKRYAVHTRSSSSKFCFNRGPASGVLTANRMTTTHEYITEVISGLKRLNMCVKKYNFEIIPDTIIHEQERIRIYCTEKKKIFEYIPDLLVRFSNNKNLVRHWGGQIAIEVNVTHSPDDTKRKHFQFLGIPLLEIDASGDLKFRFEGKDVDENQLEAYKKYLESRLSNFIATTLVYDTFSNRSLANKAYKFKEENKKLTQRIELLSVELEKSEESNELLNGDLIESEKGWNVKLKDKNRKYKKLSSEYQSYKERSFFRKLVSLFTDEKQANDKI